MHGKLVCLMRNGLDHICAIACKRKGSTQVEFGHIKFCSSSGEWISVELFAEPESNCKSKVMI